MISLRQFAKIAGVSPATVSRIFSGNNNVAPETSTRIAALAQACNFRPSVVRAASRNGNTRSIGVVMSSFNVSYFADIFRGIQAELFEEKYLPIAVDSAISNELVAINRLVDHKVDGLILGLLEEKLKPASFKSMLQLNLPLVIIETNTAGLYADVVDNDDVNGGRMAAEHLIELGHTRIGFCSYGEGLHCTCVPRFQGFREALARHNLTYNDKYTATLPFQGDDCLKRFKEDLIKILSQPDAPTAYFATTDLNALQVYEAAAELNIRIPQQLSVIGFADLNFAPYITPPLTTIRQNGFAIGQNAAKLILKRLNGDGTPPTRIVVPTELVIRKSTGRPAGA
jgi:DNA-binding LacI/PurR family transcriptional regulator